MHHHPAKRAELALRRTRSATLHTSAVGFLSDFIHSVYGHLPVVGKVFETVREPIIAYSALAAVVVVYLDGAIERVHVLVDVHDHLCDDEITTNKENEHG